MIGYANWFPVGSCIEMKGVSEEVALVAFVEWRFCSDWCIACLMSTNDDFNVVLLLMLVMLLLLVSIVVDGLKLSGCNPFLLLVATTPIDFCSSIFSVVALS